MLKKHERPNEWLLLIGSIIISIVLATCIDLSILELGALVNIFLPPLVGVCTLVCNFMLGRYVHGFRKAVLVVLIGINLAVGVILHFFDF